MHSRTTLAVFALTVSLFAQSTNVSGDNQMTLNGVGAGGTSCVTYENVNASGQLAMAHSARSNSPIITVISNACTPGAIPLAGGYSVDIDIASAVFLLDGTGLFVPTNVLTGFLNTGASGNAMLNIPNLNTTAFSTQSAYVNPTFAAGLGLSAAFNVRSGLQVVCAGTPVTLGDDTNVNVTTPFFSFYGVSYTNFFINSNGNLTFGAGNNDFSESLAEFLSGPPRMAIWWDDFNPGLGGSVTHYDNGIGQAGACFTDVPEFATSNQNDFACLFTNVNVQFSYGNMAAVDGIVGISPGGNLDPVGTPLDLSSLAAGGPATALPGTLSAYYEVFDGANPRDLGFGFTFGFNWSFGGNPTAVGRP